MKKALLAIVLTTVAGSAMAFDYENGGDTSDWKIGGQVDERCVLETYDGGDRSTSLNLVDNSFQTTASVTIWCNNKSGTNNVTYTSENNGFFLNDAGDKIEYEAEIDGKSFFLKTPQMISQISGNVNVGHQTKSFKIKPLGTAATAAAGIYSDVITATITPK
ncbi:hypothetical protein [Ferrimonas senticii]|uniref:hypothetical protein n=1 Tax=Ferrimonas senticii TaxID=394566 RepID=UPI0004861B69|nr:hypothetical protein [Ferrimonas senticii]